MGGGSSSGGTSVNYVRYAPYLEAAHQSFLSRLDSAVTTALADNPFTETEFLDFLDDSFFTSSFVLTDFPSMFDMYGKFLAGLDVETLFDEMLAHDVEAVAIDNRVGTHADYLDDEIEQVSWPRIATGLRDMNAVMSSTFINSKMLLEAQKVKAVSNYDAELRSKMLVLTTQRWQTHLEWNRGVVGMYAEIFKLYYALKEDADSINDERKAKYVLWPFTVLEYNRLGIGVLNGAQNTQSTVAGASKTQKAIGGALGGAATGAMIGAQYGSSGGPWGAAIGAVVGAGASLLTS